MKIDRMWLHFKNDVIIVDRESDLARFTLALVNNIEVRVSMKPQEFAAFQEWKVQYEPPPRPVVEKPKPEGYEGEQFAY